MATTKLDCLTISPDLLLVLRGSDLVVWLPAQRNELVLHPVILSVLARFAGGVQVSKMLSALYPLFESEPEGTREEYALDLVGRICDAGLLCTLAAGSALADNLFDLASVEDLSPTVLGRPGVIYAPRRSLALLPRPAGLVAWSPALERDVLLTPASVDLLCAIARGKLVKLGRNTEKLAGCLIKAQLLVESTDQIAAPDTPLSRPTRSYTPRGSKPRRAPSGKIPIYAVYSDDAGPLNHSPLALGMLLAYVQTYKQGVLLERYEFIDIFGEEGAFLHALRENGPGVILFSDYLWTIEVHLRISRTAKQLSPRSVTVHGGPSVPKYDAATRDFFLEHPHVDVAVHGEGEVTVCEILESFDRQKFADQAGSSDLDALRDIDGLSFCDRKNGEVIRTGQRARVSDLDILPSPYLVGTFDDQHAERWSGAIVETNRGCPYGCTFCDWGSATLQKVRRFSLDRVKSEIEWVAGRGIRLLIVADANFGIFDRDIEITRLIADARKRYGAPQEVKITYAKNATARIAEIVRIFAEAGLAVDGVISIQTTDPVTLRDINRSNIKTERYDEILQIFRKQRLPLGTDLMIGLPGSTVDSFKRDLQLYFDKEVPVMAYPTTLLPNSPMAAPEYMEKYDIKTRRAGHILYLKSTYSYTEDDWQEMNDIYAAYQILVNFSVLRHVLFFLRWDRNIAITDFLQRLQQRLRTEPGRFPCSSWLLRSFRANAVAPGGWRWFYGEMVRLAGEEFGVPRDRALDTVLRVQEALMPEQGRSFPTQVEIDHDYCAYYQDRLINPQLPRYASLDRYPPGSLSVSDPDDICGQPREGINLYYFHTATLELRSVLSRTDGPAHVLLGDRGDVAQLPPTEMVRAAGRAEA